MEVFIRKREDLPLVDEEGPAYLVLRGVERGSTRRDLTVLFQWSGEFLPRTFGHFHQKGTPERYRRLFGDLALLRVRGREVWVEPLEEATVSNEGHLVFALKPPAAFWTEMAEGETNDYREFQKGPPILLTPRGYYVNPNWGDLEVRVRLPPPYSSFLGWFP